MKLLGGGSKEKEGERGREEGNNYGKVRGMHSISVGLTIDSK